MKMVGSDTRGLGSVRDLGRGLEAERRDGVRDR